MKNSTIFKKATFVVAVFLSFAANAQFKFSKVNVADGVKTVLKSGEKVNLNISATGTVEQNFVVDIDIAAFKKAYKYDVVTIAYQRDGRTTYHYDHEFESMLNTKKYAGKGIVPVYAYDNKKFKETDYRVLAKDIIEYEGPTPIERKVAVYGKYIIGEEGYFDEKDTYQFRNKYSDGELLGYIEINTVYNKKQIEEYNAKESKLKYERAVGEIDGMNYDFKRNVINNIDQYLAPVVETPLYMALSSGFQEVWDWRVKTVKEQISSDKIEESIAIIKDLRRDYDIMKEVSKKDKTILKTMNKDIKTKTTPQDKWEYIKSNK